MATAGTIMGAAAQFNVSVRGQGGHAAMPHTTVDPVVAGAAIVTALQVSHCLVLNSWLPCCHPAEQHECHHLFSYDAVYI